MPLCGLDRGAIDTAVGPVRRGEAELAEQEAVEGVAVDTASVW